MTAPTTPEPAAPAFPPAGGRWRARVGVPIVLAGLLLVVASAFLPWVEVYRRFGDSSTDVTYHPWDLPIRALLPPVCRGPPAIRPVGGPARARRAAADGGPGALVALCGLGALCAYLFAGAGTQSVDPKCFCFGHSLANIYTRDTILVGCWCCLVGFGVLALGALVLGRAPARSGASPPS
jgi:hypothetical protein